MSGQINFWSGKNYLKRDSSSGSTSIAAPVTSYGGLGYFRTTFTVTHNLGYIPLFRVFYQPYKDGIIYPAQGARFPGTITKIDNSGTAGPICFGSPTSSTLVIELGYDANTLTGSYPIYWIIYHDYEL